jgi:UPF0176 protein
VEYGIITSVNKVILYYKFVPIKDPHMVMLWQRELCQRLGLTGRIIISTHGINGTLGGKLKNLRMYKAQMNASVTFRGITYKWSEGTGEDFPRLSVKVKAELVAFDRPEEVKVNERGVIGGGKHLKPAQVHKLVEKHGDDVVFFDGRNAYEAAVGKFKNAVIPDTETTRDFVTELESGKYDGIKDKPVVTYCTGGIRCEILSVLMKNRGFKEVYQIDGGIVKYGETYGDDGLWEGNLYIFDKRMNHTFSDKAVDIASCTFCATATSNYENCDNKLCNKLILVCEGCSPREAYCSECSELKSSTAPV